MVIWKPSEENASINMKRSTVSNAVESKMRTMNLPLNLAEEKSLVT